MSLNKPILNVLYYLTNATFIIFGMLSTLLMFAALLSAFGLMPKNLNATYELPISLKNVETYYPVTNLDPHYSIRRIEVKNAKLEVLPDNKKWPQALVYTITLLYLSFFMGILFFLSRILDSFRSIKPFMFHNVGYLRWIGFLTIVLGCYEFLITLTVTRIFHSKFSIENATILDMPSIWDFNFVALFLGLVFLALSEVFKAGNDLQELEEQTV